MEKVIFISALANMVLTPVCAITLVVFSLSSLWRGSKSAKWWRTGTLLLWSTTAFLYWMALFQSSAGAAYPLSPVFALVSVVAVVVASRAGRHSNTSDAA
jgi:hypothetical protein